MKAYFDRGEFACKCGCGFDAVDEGLVDRLTVARWFADVPFRINSGCRCMDHNKRVGGAKTSSHLRGLAVDIAAPDSRYLFRILDGLLRAGFKRIGVGGTFIHADVDPKKATPRVWTY